MNKKSIMEYKPRYKLSEISVTSFDLKFKPEFANEKIDYTFEINVDIGIVVEKKGITFKLDIIVFSSKSKTKRIGGIETFFGFEIENFKEIVKKDKNFFRVPASFMLSLLGISISTSRGILHSKFSGTFLHFVFLPIINPFDLIGKYIKDDYVELKIAKPKGSPKKTL